MIEKTETRMTTVSCRISQLLLDRISPEEIVDRLQTSPKWVNPIIRVFRSTGQIPLPLSTGRSPKMTRAVSDFKRSGKLPFPGTMDRKLESFTQ
jgi:hypothetical protein